MRIKKLLKRLRRRAHAPARLPGRAPGHAARLHGHRGARSCSASGTSPSACPCAAALPAVFAVGALGALVLRRHRPPRRRRARAGWRRVTGLMNVVMMPMFVLSGIFFSADRFPQVLQPLIRVLPLTALNDALRAVVLEGTPLVGAGGAADHPGRLDGGELRGGPEALPLELRPTEARQPCYDGPRRRRAAPGAVDPASRQGRARAQARR